MSVHFPLPQGLTRYMAVKYRATVAGLQMAAKNNAGQSPRDIARELGHVRILSTFTDLDG
jgi:hypothetical protein